MCPGSGSLVCSLVSDDDDDDDEANDEENRSTLENSDDKRRFTASQPASLEVDGGWEARYYRWLSGPVLPRTDSSSSSSSEGSNFLSLKHYACGTSQSAVRPVAVQLRGIRCVAFYVGSSSKNRRALSSETASSTARNRWQCV